MFNITFLLSLVSSFLLVCFVVSVEFSSGEELKDYIKSELEGLLDI